MQDIDDYLAANAGRHLDELKDLIRIPSVSADSRRNPDTRPAGQFVADQLKAAGLKTEIVETEGQPLVLAEWLEAPGAPTVLVYGHYDVQPADNPPGSKPEETWQSDPFDPVERDGNL